MAGDNPSKRRAVVKILGNEYVLKGNEDPAYLRRLAAMVDQRLSAIRDMSPRLGFSQAAILAALNLADELCKLELEHRRVLGIWEQEWERRKQEKREQVP